jgi:hypothetical protein
MTAERMEAEKCTRDHTLLNVENSSLPCLKI